MNLIKNSKAVDAFKVLSIDFDYFQEVTEDTVKKYYPDGCDLPSKITSVVWSPKYNKLYKGYSDIAFMKLNEQLFKQAKQILMEQDTNTPCIIEQSHIKIWDAITSEVPISKENKLQLVHIDFHHDFINDNEKQGIVDCGNWVYHATHLYTAQLLWFTRSESLKCYGMEPGEIPCFTDDLSRIIGCGPWFDMIFICRSDPWTPPHLDKRFDELKQLCEDRFSDIYIGESVESPRNMDEILHAAKEIEDMYKTMGIKEGCLCS